MQNKQFKKKKNKYETLLYSFGFVPLAYVVQDFIDQELYEECAVICDMIKDVNETLLTSLPIAFDDETIEKFIEENSGIIDFSFVLRNIDGYVNEIKKIAFETT